MSKKVLSTPKAPAALGPYSQGISFGDLIITSGQIPIKDGELIEDITEATKASLDNCKAILEQAGATMADVVKTTVFLRDIEDFVPMNEAYAEYFKENPPARSAVQIAKLPKNARLEIECLAYKK